MDVQLYIINIVIYEVRNLYRVIMRNVIMRNVIMRDVIMRDVNNNVQFLGGSDLFLSVIIYLEDKCSVLFEVCNIRGIMYIFL